MANVLVEEKHLKDIADNIRNLGNIQGKFKPADMSTEINSVYDEGYDQGYFSGEETGWDDGWNDGYDVGYEDGIAEGGGGSSEMWDAFWLRTITEAVIPDGAKRIYDYAFQDCTKLKSVEMPDTVTVIDVRAFGNCSSLEHIDFPSNLTHIYDEAFRYSGLTGNIIFPPSLKYIGCCAFEEVGGIEGGYVYFEGTPETIEEDAFCGVDIYAIYFRCSEDEAPSGEPWGAESAEIIYGWEG